MVVTGQRADEEARTYSYFSQFKSIELVLVLAHDNLVWCVDGR